MKLFNKVIFLYVFLSINLLIGCNLGSTKNELPSEKPKDFNFIFSYGVDSKNKLDTSTGNYIKDMITDPSISTNINLSDEDINTIYSEIQNINILNYPDNFEVESDTLKEPYYTYKFKIIANGIEKNIHWEDKGESTSEKAIQLRELFNKIQKIIESKEDYKKLPDVSGGYE